MSRIYHDRYGPDRALVWLVCDHCDKRAKPGAEELKGWVKWGQTGPLAFESILCEEHAHLAPDNDT